MTAAGSGAVQRELARLEQTGLVTVSRLGTQKHDQAIPDSPLFAELCGILRKTAGLAEPLREALAPLAAGIAAAFVYASVAKGGDTATSDRLHRRQRQLDVCRRVRRPAAGQRQACSPGQPECV